MSVDIAKLKSRATTLSNSLDELEAILEPLFAQTLPETVLNLEPLQQAKLQTDIPYVIYDLVFMYLKLKGVDPKSHPVVGELDRIRQYFEKISNTENPPQRRAEIDKAAANRFIKHAISSVKWTKTAAEEDESPDASTSSAPVPVKVTSKMLERQEYEKKLKEKAAEGESEEEDLAVFDNDEAGEEGAKMDVDATPAVAPTMTTSQKRGRAAVDPFAGYDESTPTDTPSTADAATSKTTDSPEPSLSTSQPKSKKKKTAAESTGKKKKATGKKKAAAK